MPRIVEIERGPQGFRHDKRYPVSIFQLYDEIGGGLGVHEDKPVYLGGGTAIIADARNVILQGLIGGGKALVDGQEIEVGPMRAAELVESYLFPNAPAVEAAFLAWTILNAAINGVQLKKKEAAEDTVKSPRSRKGKSSPTADS
ncbi:hypothetical protein [Sphingobium sp. SYK-6]|uniref:hypothetical protein n=1 Tax=Sphingobium sp. (strain NBRC 103272 / SYK-6) TaxID=627192 RepID=UPI0011D20FBE|nr:hypothetical protein [Sphingobium sp. SYK-6]